MANSTVTDALTKIFLALGGDTQKLQDDHNLTDYLDDLGDALVKAVKAELPAVTSADNGKFLSVVNGAWNKADVPSGGEEFLITVTYDEDDQDYKMDKTGEEIIAAFMSGKTLIAVPNFNNFGNGKLRCVSYTAFSDNNPSEFGFVGTLWGGSDDFYQMAIYIGGDSVYSVGYGAISGLYS